MHMPDFTLYHSSLFAGHQRVIKTYITMSDIFFHIKFNSLPAILYQRLSYFSISKKLKTTEKTVTI